MSTILELLANEPEEYQKVLCQYQTQPCKTIAIQNPVIKDPSLIIQHQLGKRCHDFPCMFFHWYEEKRRPIVNEHTQSIAYNAIPCPAFLEKFLCDDIDSCVFSHCHNEIIYHPTRYKTRECINKSCPFENFPYLCPNLHPNEPNRSPLVKSYDKLCLNIKPSCYQASKPRPLMNLNDFKTKPCHKKGNHDKKTCPYYHNEIDKRRHTSQYNYCFEVCSNINRNYCSCDQNCLFSKNKVEQLYHPDKYKKKFCENFPYQINKCEYGEFCSFAHNEGEIRTEPLYKDKQDDNFNMYKLKTVYCPFRNEHDRSTCPYAHNVQDFRRNPLMYKYEPEECPYWSKADSLTSYEQPGCIKMLDCDKCHGWKEFEYHPQIYKTRLCSGGSKCLKKDCAYYHSNKDKRYFILLSYLTH